MTIRSRTLLLFATPLAIAALSAFTLATPPTVRIGVGLSEAEAQQQKRPGLSLTCENVRRIQDRFFEQHVLYKAPDAAIEARTIEQFIKRLDSAKLYLRQSDVNQIRTQMKGLYKSLENDNCTPILNGFATLEKRVEERVEFAKKTLNAKNFKFDPNTTLVLDPDSRKYPATVAEQEAYQRRYLQFQLSNQLATGLKQDEAIAQVIRTYERGLKRIKEANANTELRLADYLESFGRSLDPHTSYFSKDALEDFEVQMSLSLEGIGASLSSQDGFTVVEQLIDGGSAKASGLVRQQDKIVAVGQIKADGTEEQLENVVEMDLRDVVRRIRGPKGTKVRLQLLRQNTDGSKERVLVTLARDKIKLEEDAAQLSMQTREIDGKPVPFGVLNLPSFYADGRRGGRSAASDMKKLIAEAREKGAKGLVVDFSTNGGGSLDDAVKIAGLFFKNGNVVKQSNRDPNRPALTLADRDPAVDWNGPLVILTSRVSASASEIVAGTLKDYNRAVVVGGDHTFGKGSVQSVQELAPGLGALKTTVGWFFTPSGFSTQWRGVDADIVFPSAFSIDEIGEKSLDYSLKPKELPAFRSKEALVTSGPDAWKEVSKQEVAQLKSRAEVRIA
ncbi:MAG: S41 family peptidase [Bdellovibrionales bacterium]|jgi:carboxyl-terminal processing protease|nr:S41 family peptidase [Bdellovibrionales bacterium]